MLPDFSFQNYLQEGNIQIPVLVMTRREIWITTEIWIATLKHFSVWFSVSLNRIKRSWELLFWSFYIIFISAIQGNEQSSSPNCWWVKADGLSEGQKTLPGRTAVTSSPVQANCVVKQSSLNSTPQGQSHSETTTPPPCPHLRGWKKWSKAQPPKSPQQQLRVKTEQSDGVGAESSPPKEDASSKEIIFEALKSGNWISFALCDDKVPEFYYI